MARVTCDGKWFRAGAEPFAFRGVTYGTFAPRPDGAQFPEYRQIKRDFEAMRDAGFTVVRTYTAPPDDLLDAASDWGLRVFAGVFFPDWRYLVGAGRRQQAAVLREGRAAVGEAAARLAGDERVVALSVGNEIPADVIRWMGSDRAARFVACLADAARDEDDGLLVSYANYPTAEYLPLESLDFATFNVFLENRGDYRRYLTRLQHLAGDRPLVLGEVGLDAGAGADGERRQAETLDWQLRTALERGVAGGCVFSWTDEWWVGGSPVEGWHFGLTRADRTPRPALDVVSAWNRRTVADLDVTWPTISVVVCAYNADPTLDECLSHTCALDYPGLEVVVVDDGSVDDTAAVARRHPRARLVQIPHAGLSAARNAGLRASSGDVVAYLDADAYPTPEWPYYLALGFDSAMVGGAGGPNVPPTTDPVGARQVARAPGGPVHVLVSDDRAEHVPGCNMAFWRAVLEEVGGFDPVYTAAGDDVDLCWKVLDRGWEIGFHPAALVWHHRRSGLLPYLRQQRGYGRAEALVAARHPDRFTWLGSARWRGRIYNSLVPVVGRPRIYRGLYGAAAYQSVYAGGGYALDIVHQAGMPAAAALALAGVALGAVAAPLAAAVLAAVAAFIVLLVGVDAVRAHPPATLAAGRLRFRLGVAAMHVLQPLVRTWARARAGGVARRDIWITPLPAPIERRSGVLVLPADRPRAAIVGDLVGWLRACGVRVAPATGWEPFDARLNASALVVGELLSSAYPEGCVQVRLRRRASRRALPAAALVLVLWLTHPLWATAGCLLVAGDLARGLWRTGPWFGRVVRIAAAEGAPA